MAASMEPPEAKGTTKVMGLSGKPAAMAEAASAQAVLTVAAVQNRRRANEWGIEVMMRLLIDGKPR